MVCSSIVIGWIRINKRDPIFLQCLQLTCWELIASFSTNFQMGLIKSTVLILRKVPLRELKIRLKLFMLSIVLMVSLV